MEHQHTFYNNLNHYEIENKVNKKILTRYGFNKIKSLTEDNLESDDLLIHICRRFQKEIVENRYQGEKS